MRLGRSVDCEAWCGMPLMRYRTAHLRTMADLAEVGFVIDGVLNFTVTLICNEQCDELQLALKTLNNLNVRASTRRALDGVALSMTVVDTISPSMAKRTIFDRRQPA